MLQMWVAMGERNDCALKSFRIFMVQWHKKDTMINELIEHKRLAFRTLKVAKNTANANYVVEKNELK